LPNEIVGLVLDLDCDDWGDGERIISESGLTHEQMGSPESTIRDWDFETVLTTLSVLVDLPVVLTNSGRRRLSSISHHRSNLVEYVDFLDTDNTWRSAISTLLNTWHCTKVRLGSTIARRREDHVSSKHIFINSTRYIDLERCTLCFEGRTISLTGREVRVLELLGETPRRFYTATRIASYVEQFVSYTIDKHCIEETVRGLRRKFEESGRRASILVSRRGLGYALFPQTATTVTPVYSACGANVMPDR
jgi:Transcriptional regulatory protein, C terminal